MPPSRLITRHRILVLGGCGGLSDSIAMLTDRPFVAVPIWARTVAPRDRARWRASTSLCPGAERRSSVPPIAGGAARAALAPICSAIGRFRLRRAGGATPRYVRDAARRQHRIKTSAPSTRSRSRNGRPSGSRRYPILLRNSQPQQIRGTLGPCRGEVIGAPYSLQDSRNRLLGIICAAIVTRTAPIGATIARSASPRCKFAPSRCISASCVTPSAISHKLKVLRQ